MVERHDEVAGEVGLSAFDREAGTAEIGWWTAPAHRGKGVASTAAGLLVRWVLDDLGLSAVIARCQAENAASIAIARRIELRPSPDASTGDLWISRPRDGPDQAGASVLF